MKFRVRALVVSLILLNTAARAAQTIHYVDVNSANPAPPYTNWATAARRIQNVINIAGGGDLILWPPANGSSKGAKQGVCL